MHNIHDVIVRPLVTEKSHEQLDGSARTPSWWPRTPTRSRSPRRREAVQREGHRRPHHALRRQGQAHGQARRPPGLVEEGRRDPRRRAIRSSSSRGCKMPTKQFKPVTPGTRFRSTNDFAEVTHKGRPEKSLTEKISGTGGRNHHGHITTRHKGGGHKRLYRVIDFRRDKVGVPAKVERHRVRPQPHREHRAAGVRGRRAPLHPAPPRAAGGRHRGHRPGRRHQAGQRAAAGRDPAGHHGAQRGAAPGKGGQMARSAGAGVQIAAKEGDYVTLRMPSTEMRMVRRECMATVGQVGNVDHEKQSDRQGGRQPLAGQAPHGARRGDEPRRPPAGRRRGPELRRPSPGLPLGQARGREDAPQEEGVEPADRPRPQARPGDEVKPQCQVPSA